MVSKADLLPAPLPNLVYFSDEKSKPFQTILTEYLLPNS